MEIQLNNFDDLITFIEREDVSHEQALKVICKSLNVFSISFENEDKKELIKNTKEHIRRWGNYNGEQPIFLLGQKDVVFNIKDIYV